MLPFLRQNDHVTSNFDFVPWPEIRDEAQAAERAGKTDPRVSMFYARRVVETVIGQIFEWERLPEAYRADLKSRLHDDRLRGIVPSEIVMRADAIRKLGNRGVHDKQAPASEACVNALMALYDVLKWVTHTYHLDASIVPVGKAFDVTAIPAPDVSDAPRHTQAQMQALEEAAERKDAELAALKAKEREKAAQREAYEAQIAELQRKLAERQVQPFPAADFNASEARIRELYIDEDLRQAGWSADAIKREFPVTGMRNHTGTGYVDYVLFGANGKPLGLVEAKRASRDPMVAEQQAKLYADCLEREYGQRPVIMWSNGIDHYLLDDANWTHGVGYPYRKIAQFLSPDSLQLIIQRRTSRADLADVPINAQIAGRAYQEHAIRQIDDALMNNRREALLVMATGTGKTRTVIALIDQLLKANWARRVLFLADRRTLVTQAAKNLREHLPNNTVVNLVDERDGDGEVFVSTYPTMLNAINDLRDGQRRFDPGFFDLVVIDEAHRSVYQKYTEIFRWFDGMLIGLTATPKEEIDRNTYRLFKLEDGVPTDAYPYEQAVKEKYLTDYEAMDVPTRFMRQGIRYADLTDEQRDEWDSLDWGEDDIPDDINPEALNKWLFNKDTVRKVLATLMEQGVRVAEGDRVGKTIIFARNNDHANFIADVFGEEYPDLGPNFARVITYQTEYAQSLIDDFSDKTKTPHIAISVDMLDTGIDVPEVVNLIMFKPVRSYAKFWQMLGRGTRLCDDLDGLGTKKTTFRIFDLCGNFEFIGANPGNRTASLPVSLNEKLFVTRAQLVGTLDAQRHDNTSSADVREAAVSALRAGIARMNPDNFIVRPHRATVERFQTGDVWANLSRQDVDDLVSLAKLPGAGEQDDHGAKQFDLLTLTAQLAVLENDAATLTRMQGRIRIIADALLENVHIPAIKPNEPLLRDLESDEWWVDVTPAMLELVRKRLRVLVHLIEQAKRPPVMTDFADELGEIRPVRAGDAGVGVNYERFLDKLRDSLKQHESKLVLQRLRRNKQLTPDDLVALESILAECADGHDDLVARGAQQADGLGLFVRSIMGLEREAAQEAFDEFRRGRNLNARQLRLVNMIIDELTVKGVVDPARLFEPPYTSPGTAGVFDLFTPDELTTIQVVLDDVRSNAIA